MGTLIAMRYPTPLFANLADHTYVKCGTGKAAWGCWGGKTRGKQLRQGPGSTKRADKIARPDEKASIKCYLINGVCHQAANRILLPAGITVRGARGYNVSQALFGTYGKVGIWPCRSPFNQFPSVTGDLRECEVKKTKKKAKVVALSESAKSDWQYLRGELDIYREADHVMASKSLSGELAAAFHMKLFMYMAEYHLGPLLDKKKTRTLERVRERAEQRRAKVEAAFARREMAPAQFVEQTDADTITFQQEMAESLSEIEYQSLFDLKRGDVVVLADPRIVKKAFPE